MSFSINAHSQEFLCCPIEERTISNLPPINKKQNNKIIGFCRVLFPRMPV